VVVEGWGRMLEGINYYKEKKFSVFRIRELSESIKKSMREQLAEICHGEDYVKTGRRAYNYENTIKEFLKRYEKKSEKIRIGMIGELLVHLIFYNYFYEYKTVTPFFNMEERSIKKGYDIVLTEVDNPILWITEVKSGNLHSNKNSNQTMNDLIGTANEDLTERLNNENVSLWMEAVNCAKISFDSRNEMKQAVVDVLLDWNDEATDGSYSSHDKNVILAGVLFADMEDEINDENAKKKQNRIETTQTFQQVYVLEIQKATYSKIYDFLKEEASSEE
jgi:hypothetical protein